MTATPAPARHRAIVSEGSAREIGGKAAALAALAGTGLRIPPWFAIAPPPGNASGALPPDLAEGIRDAVRELSPHGRLVAVRSSAVEEDGAEHSFAGQFESFLYVAPADVPGKVAEVWRTASSERVEAYRRERGVDGSGAPRLPAVLVQRMIDPEVAGVAFSADPATGRRGIAVVSATYGTGSALVSGEADADAWQVDRDGRVVHRVIATKRVAHRAGAGGTVTVAVEEAVASRPALSDADVTRVAALARAAERHFGRPQDIEWAIAGGELWLLQSRPITSLAALRDPDGALALWDNSNITESYGGVTTPLTYSFARYVYEEVYRQFCRILRIPESRVAENSDALRTMLGLVRGRVYYNLASWYRILSLLPGYRLNRRFMEQMMGVKEGLPPEIEAHIVPAARGERARDAVALLGTIAGLVGAHRRIDRDVVAFHARLEEALATGGDLSHMRADELVAHYRELERRLLTRWDAPLVNDFLAMVFYGLLRSLTARWCGDTDGTLQNDLVSGEGAIVSAEPARRIVAMAEQVTALAPRDRALVPALAEGSLAEARAAIARHRELARAYDEYLERFGDRCLEELKLETTTLGDDPLSLVRAVGRLAKSRLAAPADPQAAPAAHVDVRGVAEARAAQALGGGNPLRAPLFRWVLRNARHRVRDRENLRFERTRVFGRVRRIFVELGRRYAAAGALDDPRDIFYLTVEEALGWTTGTSASADIRALAAARRAEFDRYRADGAEVPPDRFQTHGMVHVGPLEVRAPSLPPAAADGELRRGTGCYPGVVRGRVRVVRDPRGAVLEPGEILVAERTDPGWVMLFPAASALLVERGSLLSHSAIVARELGLPAVIAIEGLTSWLRTGDEVELDGRTGEVRRMTGDREGSS